MRTELLRVEAISANVVILQIIGKCHGLVVSCKILTNPEGPVSLVCSHMFTLLTRAGSIDGEVDIDEDNLSTVPGIQALPILIAQS